MIEDFASRLDRIASDSWYADGPNAVSIGYRSAIFERHLRPGNCLELGPAEGLMTEMLAGRFGAALTCVEGSSEFARQLKQRHPGVTVINTLFEAFAPFDRFDNIILGHVLEHVVDPVNLLQLVRSWLSPEGVVLASVPNANSIHRQIAVEMHLLEDVHELNSTDQHHGHMRVYDPEMLRGDFLAAGLSIRTFGGYWIKPVSDAQLKSTWTGDMLLGAMRIGERYPEIGAEIYVVAGL